jgi:translation initiation factor 4A
MNSDKMCDIDRVENKYQQENYLEESFEGVEIYEDFEQMDLPDNLLRGIYGYGFEIPSAVQQKGIVCLKQGRDVIVQAQSGTGKTGTFTIGTLATLNPNILSPHALILAPTRELAEQTENVVSKIGNKLDVKVRCCIGGRPVFEDENALKEGVHIVVGTPGRIIDLLSRGKINVDYLRIMILDEADEMLNTDFQEDMRTIFKFVPEDIQVGLFSATMPPSMLEISRKFMHDPIKILVKKEVLTLDGIMQFYIDCEREEYTLSDEKQKM